MQPVECSNPDSVDYGWVMQVTFITAILVGPPIVAILSANTGLQTWGARAESAIRVGVVVWFVTAVVLFVYAKRTNVGDGGTPPEAKLDVGIDTEG